MQALDGSRWTLRAENLRHAKPRSTSSAFKVYCWNNKKGHQEGYSAPTQARAEVGEPGTAGSEGDRGELRWPLAIENGDFFDCGDIQIVVWFQANSTPVTHIMFRNSKGRKKILSLKRKIIRSGMTPDADVSASRELQREFHLLAKDPKRKELLDRLVARLIRRIPKGSVKDSIK